MQNPKVLLVEDQKIVQMLHITMLEKLGCQIDLAETAEQALAKSKNKYDVIFMDICLPDRKGTEVAAEIRQSENGKDIPIIAVTSLNKTEIDCECVEAGMDAIYNKPLAFDVLQKILNQYAVRNEIDA